MPHAENRVFRKWSCDPKLLIGGCRACFGDLESILKILKNVKVWFQRILKEFKVTILEKFIFEKVPISTFNPNFWPLGGAKTKF